MAGTANVEHETWKLTFWNKPAPRSRQSLLQFSVGYRRNAIRSEVLLPAWAIVLIMSGPPLGLGAKTPQDSPRVVGRPQGSAALQLRCEQLLQLAAADPTALLEKALSWYDKNVRDYTGFFAFHERKGARLGNPAACRFKFRSKPFSVAMQWIREADRADKLLYVEGQNNNRLIVHPTGWVGRLVTSVAIDPRSKQARTGASRTICDFGLRNIPTRILEAYREANTKDEVRSDCLGISDRGGTKVITIRRSDLEGTLTFGLEIHTLMPVRIVEKHAKGKLVSHYEFTELRFNNGVDDSTFSKAAYRL